MAEQRWRLTINFVGERDTFGLDDDWLSPIGLVVNKAKEVGEFVQGRVTGFAFERTTAGRTGRDDGPALLEAIQHALLAKQEELELERGSPTLWPGTAASVATDVVSAWIEAGKLVVVPRA